MKLSVNWLNTYLSEPISVQEAEEILTQVGLEVEGIEKYESIPGGLSGVMVGKVISVAPHPDADRLRVTRVTLNGTDELQIVCGAPNVAENQHVLVATVGTKLRIDGKELEIKKSKIRGVESNGMICAEDELGLGSNHDGIMVLPDTTPLGISAAEYLSLVEDFVLEINITPNRADAISHLGCARDIVAYLQCRDKNIELVTPSIPELNAAATKIPATIQIESESGAPRYNGVVLSAVKVSESPAWMQHRLKAIGLQPINSIVDITNYVMFETGQPLHAFDWQKIDGGTIRVNHEKEGTSFVTLDGTERKLSVTDLMISSQTTPLCIAGVYGGLNSGITEETTTLFLESAWFNASMLRKTARKQGLHTDASFRFERGTDPNGTVFALKRAVSLMQDIAGAQVASEWLEHYPQPVSTAEIRLTQAKLSSVTGMQIPAEKTEIILKALGFALQTKDPEGWIWLAPTNKVDVTRDVDIIEEVLRIYGFEQIPITGKLQATLKFEPKKHTSEALEKTLSQLIDRGYNQCLNLSFHDSRNYAWMEDVSLARVKNPISSELDVMRGHLLFSLLKVAGHNINRRELNLQIFESGRIYRHQPGATTPYTEEQIIGLLWTGENGNEHWKNKPRKYEFTDVRGGVEEILRNNRIPFKPVETAATSNAFSQSFVWNAFAKEEIPLASAHLVHPKLAKTFDIKQPVWYAQIHWDAVASRLPGQPVAFKELPRFPWVRRDLALLVNETASYAEMEKIALGVDKKILREVNLFDVYEGKNLPEGKKSCALSFIFRADDRTLTDAEIEPVMDKLVQAYRNQLQAELRS